MVPGAQLAMLKVSLFKFRWWRWLLSGNRVDRGLDHHSRLILLQRWLDKEPKLRQRLNVAEQQQNDDDQEQEPNPATGIISPARAADLRGRALDRLDIAGIA